MDSRLTYETWFASQWNLLHPATRAQMPATLDDVESLAHDVARNGSEYDSSAETLAIAADGLLAELRARREADLSAEDVEALEEARTIVAHAKWDPGAKDAALTALDKLLTKGAR